MLNCTEHRKRLPRHVAAQSPTSRLTRPPATVPLTGILSVDGGNLAPPGCPGICNPFNDTMPCGWCKILVSGTHGYQDWTSTLNRGCAGYSRCGPTQPDARFPPFPINSSLVLAGSSGLAVCQLLLEGVIKTQEQLTKLQCTSLASHP